ncbi:MAG: YeeE/YedE thiosulfate transporter family protein [Thiobacillaceae bacterium]|nr:YeeE/YedE thiosulfate transporter family protein [Thiobacillaceae bacterium]MCX7672575.1 YeeE/YedE thiosulfate transporter family protein [Thiobacillaceae bacterium]MDW8322515.1 YeeE/YedE thiosulfate transporter family protein [Burkholderiales bacterium]
MDTILAWLYAPWPWYVAGPLIGLMVPLMLFIGNRSFGISSNLRHLCAITQPRHVGVDFFQYDWKEHTWSLVFVVGTALGGFLAGVVFANPQPVAISPATQDMLLNWGFTLPAGSLVPEELFHASVRNYTLLFACGVLVGFGTRYAAGCTSGHAITGLSTLQLPSLWAVVGIFGGGLFSSWLLVPWMLK